MLNIPDLEHRWLQYKIKSYIPHVTILMSTIIIGIIIIIISKPNIEKSQHNKDVANSQSVVKITPKIAQIETQDIEEKKVLPKPSPKPVANVEATILTPSLNFIKKMENSSQPYYDEKSDTNIEPPKQEITQTAEEIEEVVLDTEVEKEVNPVLVPAPSNIITIKRKSTNKDLMTIIKRFKKNNNPELSLFIAQKYYDLGNYHQSYNYALITNQIDSKLEASWILFAKSLVKLNKKSMAVKTLQDYIKQSHSSSAQTLLDEIILGKFK